jgi:hypothetical protein
MKPKFIYLLIMLVFAGLSASPNRYCDGITNKKPFPVSPFTFHDDESDLIPTKYFFNHI